MLKSLPSRWVGSFFDVAARTELDEVRGVKSGKSGKEQDCITMTDNAPPSPILNTNKPEAVVQVLRVFAQTSHEEDPRIEVEFRDGSKFQLPTDSLWIRQFARWILLHIRARPPTAS